MNRTDFTVKPVLLKLITAQLRTPPNQPAHLSGCCFHSLLYGLHLPLVHQLVVSNQSHQVEPHFIRLKTGEKEGRREGNTYVGAAHT